MRRAAQTPVRAQRLIFAMLGSALVVAMWLPTTRVPIYGDDFWWSSTWYRNFGGSAARALTTAWISDLQENRFNPVGRWFALNYHFFAFDFSATIHMDIHWYYRIGALLMVWGAIVASAYALREALRFVDPANRVSLWTLFAGIAAGMAVIVQLHPRSHDPLLTISEIGYATEILSFLLLGLAFRAARSTVSTASAVVPIGVLSVVGVYFYETFISAIVAATIIYIVLLVRARRGEASARRPVLLLVFGVAVPAVAFLVGRWVVQFLPNVAPYQGTEFMLRGGSLRVFTYLLLAGAPGTGWADAASRSDGIRLTLVSLLAAGAILALVILLLLLLRRVGRPRIAPTRLLWMVAAVFAVHLAVTLGMQAVTYKYILEITRLGDVYISYGATVLVVSLIVVLLLMRAPRVPVAALIVALPLLGGLVVVQQAVNWTTAETFAREYAGDRAITAAIVRPDLTNEERCRVFDSWKEAWGNAVFEPDMRDGMQFNFEHKFGVPFCER